MADFQSVLSQYSETASHQFQKVPGSAILLRYIRSSYQDDPIRSAIELFLFLFAVGYLLSPKYETKDKNKIKLTEDVRVFAAAHCHLLTPRNRRLMTWLKSGSRRLS